MATLVEVADGLDKLGFTTQIVSGRGDITDCLNLYIDDRFKPVATVWPPNPPRLTSWTWGHAYEYTASELLPAPALALLISDSLT